LTSTWVEAWSTPLTPWYLDVAWDATWFVINNTRRQVTVICVTDSD
jgi:hypothetical protein